MTKPRKADQEQFKRQARRERIAKATLKVNGDTLPPHSPEAERGALGCLMLAAGIRGAEYNVEGSLAEVDALILQLKPAHFYELRHRDIFESMRELRIQGHAMDFITLQQWMKDKGKLQPGEQVAYLAGLPDASGGIFIFPEYLAILKEKHQRRWLQQRAVEFNQLAGAESLDLEDIRGRIDEIAEATSAASGKRAELKVWRFNELMQFVPPKSNLLIGEEEIRKGVDGVVVLAGPGGSGKSLLIDGICLAGAIGKGHWQGRTIHRKFRTLVIQAENGNRRLKKLITAVSQNHPGIDFNDHIFISEPPSGGIPFHRSEFRSALRREIEAIKPDLLVIDPWSRVAADDSSKDVVDKIAEIQSCLPGGDDCPGLVIAAHTKKPRAEDVRKGRALANLISGSVALKDSARCVYMLLPWSEETDDERVYFCCAKLNDAEMYPPSVWKRRFGTFFQHDGETDPSQWGEEPDANEERRSVTREMLVTVFKETKRPGMKRGELVRELVNRFDLAESTVWRALKTYGAEWVDMVAGVVALKKGGKE